MDTKKILYVLLAAVFLKTGYSYLNTKNKINSNSNASNIELEKAQPNLTTDSSLQVGMGPAPMVNTRENWPKQVEDLKKKNYSEASEATGAVTSAINKLMLDDNLPYEQKMKLRNELTQFEDKIRHEKFIDKKIIGYKKQLKDPNDPRSGYVVEDIVE